MTNVQLNRKELIENHRIADIRTIYNHKTKSQSKSKFPASHNPNTQDQLKKLRSIKWKM